MRVLVVSGIWPPDVGGPASHAPDFAAFLRDRGHNVHVVITADAKPTARSFPVRAVSRRLPPGVRHAAVVAAVGRRARSADVVYATSMIGRATVGAALARRPVVAKIVADPAYERALRRGLFSGSLAEFQRASVGRTVRLLRGVRAAALRRASHVVCPSAFLAELAVAWGVPRERITVLPNPAPDVPADEAPRRSGEGGPPLLAFAGRLTPQKALHVLLEALADVDGVELEVAGDGPERAACEESVAALGLEGRVRFLGALDRARVLELFRRADAAVLSSAWENFPHTIVEALAVGTPVIATDVGGVGEVVRDGENGLLVPHGDASAFAEAIRRYFADAPLRERLRAHAAPSVEPFGRVRIYGRLERILVEAAG